VQKNSVQAARPVRRRGRLVGGLSAHLSGPRAALGDVVQNREIQRARCGHGAGQEFPDLVDPFTLSRGSQHDRRAQLARERRGVDLATPPTQVIGHIEDHESGQSQRQHRGGQHEMPAQIGRVQDQQDGIRARRVGAPAGENVPGHLLIFRAGSEAIDAWQVDDMDLAAVRQIHLAGMLFDGNAGKIAHLLAKAGQAIKQGGFAAIGRTYDSHDPRLCLADARGRLAGQRASVAATHRRRSLLCVDAPAGAPRFRAAAPLRNHPPGKRTDRRRARSIPL